MFVKIFLDSFFETVRVPSVQQAIVLSLDWSSRFFRGRGAVMSQWRHQGPGARGQGRSVICGLSLLLVIILRLSIGISDEITTIAIKQTII